MRKIVSIVVFGSVLSFTALQAKVQADGMENIVMTQKVSQVGTGVSKNDMNMLFDNVDSSRVAMLDSVEMSETKGEFFGTLALAFLTPIAVAGGNWVADRIINYWFK